MMPGRPAVKRDGVAAMLVGLVAAGLFQACARPAPVALIPAGYGSWPTTTTLRLDYPIPGHEDRFRVIHINAKGLAFTRSGSDPERIEFPEGTIIAKDIFGVSNPGPADKPVMVTAMMKSGNDPAARGGWVWVVKNLEKGDETVMSGDFCVRCHDNANEKHPYGWKNPDSAFADYVFFIPGTDSGAVYDGY